MDQKLMEAFVSVTKICVAEEGDILKDDLLLIADKLGFSEQELLDSLPELFERESEDEEELEDEEDEGQDIDYSSIDENTQD